MRSLLGWCLIARRYYSNHYDVLGVSTKATLRDIKSAYYRLSMIYHPDRNKGSKEAAEKFCKLKAAYEVLADPTTKRDYDKSLGYHRIVPTTSTSASTPGTSASVRSHHKYNFEEWYRLHYEQSFARRNEAKARYKQKVKFDEDIVHTGKKENVVFTVVIIFILFVLVSYACQKDLDNARSIKERALRRSKDP